MSSIRGAAGWALMGGATVQCLPALACHVPPLCPPLGLRRRLTEPGTVALTFDDGPHPEGTERVLSILSDHGAHATFFLVGEQVRRRPALAAEIVSAGHTIGLHGETHRCELRLTSAQLAEDRARGLEAIHTATGVLPVIHRPPYGASSGPGIALARRAGLETILWSRWGRDWRATATPDTVTNDVARKGPLERDIVLLHDADEYGAPQCWRATVGALPRILELCGTHGLRAVAL